MTVGMLALIIVAVILAQVSFMALVGLYRRKRKYRNSITGEGEPQTTTKGQLPGFSLADELVTTDHGWEGFKEFIVQHRILEDDGQSICSFYLVPVDGRPLPSYKPGQYLTFKLPVDDPKTHELRTVVRCYSLSDSPSPDHYRISVKRMLAPTDGPEVLPGLSSNYFHDQIHEGSHLLVKAPSGHFHLMEDEPLPVVLIAGGIGITPMLSIINTLIEKNSDREIWLFYGVRNGSEQIMKEHLQLLAKDIANLHLHVCYSRPSDHDKEGVDFQHRGQIDIPLLRSTLKLMRYQFYVCGPKTMMETLVPGLEEWGVSSKDIYYESFGPATLVKHEKPIPRKENNVGHGVAINFSKSGTNALWYPDAGSLLEFAETQGVEVESGCRAGSCGCCQTLLEAGEVEYSQQPDADVEPGHCLLCISTPKGDLTLAA